MKRAIHGVVVLSLLATAAHGQQTQDTLIQPRTGKVRQAAYQRPMDDVLGNPFGDESAAPIPSTSELAATLSKAPPVVTVAPNYQATQPCTSHVADCPTNCVSDCNTYSLSDALHKHCTSAVEIGGWISAGYHSADNGLFNNRSDNLAVHQSWLYAEKIAEAGTSPIGFRFDLMYGIDGVQTQAFGNNSGEWDYANGFDHGAYGWAIPQAYLELAVGEWNIKAGHFYTLIGYEVVGAPDNFFYSHAITMVNSEPFTHTGVVASRDIGNATVFAGWTLGWDTGFDQFNEGNSWLGGISKPLCDDITFTYMSTAGNFGRRGENAYSHSILFDTTLTDKLNWVVQSDLLRIGSTGEDNVGINQYFLYDVSERLGLGARLEWWKGDGITAYAPHGGTVPMMGSYSNYAATLGANIRPSNNLVFRPEVRFDWSPAANYDESYFGVDAVLTF